ncbi:MAG: S1-like domain-containing RNA-binding protein [Bacteroidales bacterium]|nr:S1-like domain-containing RNA-binding protein [Bacteroidales bacterium]
MIKLGQYNHLTIIRFTDHGAYVDGGEIGEILLPKAYVKDEMHPGDEVDVFVYLDQQERLVATMEEPYAQVGDFAYLEVSWVNQYGAFLDWGLMKDLFVPFSEQKKTMEQGNSYIIYIYVDDATKRIVGTAKVNRYIQPAPHKDYYRGKTVDLLVWQKTEYGLKVIVDNKYSGLIYNDELQTYCSGQHHDVPRTGDRLQGTVVTVRDDGRLDISLQKIGKGRFRDFADELLEELEAAGGFLAYTDKSSSEAIAERFGVSKKTFKRAVGTLYKARKISLKDDGISIF